MGLNTLNGNKITSATITIPAWGCAYHDVELDGEITLAGKVTLVVADLTLSCAVLSGGPGKGRSWYRLVAGAGGWGLPLPAKSYANDAGIKLATILGDAASAAGEILDASTVSTSARVGPYFVRPAGPACRVLEQIAPSTWYVGEDGITRIGQRPATTLPTAITETSQVDLARGIVILASDTIASILPGVTIAGLIAVDVEHNISAKGGLRTTIWGQQGKSVSRELTALRAVIEQLFPNLAFAGLSEYRVVTQTGNRLNLQPVRVSTGMPTLSRVPVRPGVAGSNQTPAVGSRVIVGFLDSNPAYPVVISFEDPDGAGFAPTSVALGGATGNPVARLGDQVTVFLPPALVAVGTVSGNPFTGTITIANPITGIITGGSAKVTSA